MKISREILEFLNDATVKKALVADNIEKIYSLATDRFINELDNNNLMGEFTYILLQAGIDPLQGMTEIPESFLYDQGDITEFNIPQGIVKIGYGAFENTGLESITIPDSVKEIKDWAFMYYEDLKAVRLPAGVRLGSEAFYDSGIESVELVNAELGGGVFSECFSLKNAVIKGNTRELPFFMFSNCSELEHVELPVYLEEVEGSTFFLCKNLREVRFEGTADQWKHVAIHRDNEELFNCKITCSDGTLKYDGTAEEWVVV